MKKIVDLDTFANGAVSEKFDRELRKVLENIADPNTDPKKKRTLTLTVKITGNSNRDLATAEVEAKSKLVPALPVHASILMDWTEEEGVTGAELKSGIPGQTYIAEDGDVRDDRGGKIEDAPKQAANDKKILKFQ